MGKLRAWLVGGAALAVVGLQLTPGESPRRTVLSENELGAIVGGIAATTININFPQNFVTADFAASDSVWNIAGNRCQFGCTSGSEPDRGPTNVGFNVFAAVALPDGVQTDGPFLEVYNNGQGRARTEANVVNIDTGIYTLYVASLRTVCVNGTTVTNTHCNLDTECGTGRCATCDHNNVCSNGSPNPLPCSNRCSGGSRNGKICTCISGCTLDCPGVGTTCEDAFEDGAQTCYLLGGCGKETLVDVCEQDCTTSGSVIAGTTATKTNGGPIHSAFFRVTYHTADGPDDGSFEDEVEVGRSESIYRVVNKASGSPNCEGGAE